MNNITFGQYYNSDSWIHKLDPRVKIISVILFLVFTFLFDNIYFLIGNLGVVIIIIMSSKIPFVNFLKSLKMITFLLFFMFFFQVLFRKTGNLLVTFNFTLTLYNLIISCVLIVLYFLSSKIIKKFRFLLFLIIVAISFVLQVYFIQGLEIVQYKIAVYDDSLSLGLTVFIRLVSILFISSLLTLSTKPMDLNLGLERLLSFFKVFKLNVSIFTMMISISLRFIPTLINEANKILKAQASRGVDFKEGSLKDKINQIVSLIIPMFAISYKRAIDLSDAMEARGYNPDSKRSSLNVLKFKASDYVVLILLNMALITMIVIKIIYKI